MYINQNNLKQHQEYLQDHKYLRVSHFLNEDFAKRISDCLENDVEWGLACRIGGESQNFQKTNDVCNLEKGVSEKLKSQLNDKFQFIYNSYMMVTAYIDKRDPDHFLNRLLEWLNSHETINYFSELTSTPNLVKINAQATRYIAGHFLTQHDDTSIKEGRLYAYVLGFTKNWNPDWGGLLHILNSDGEIVKTLIPEYNSLSIFEVPQNHFVSYVTPQAQSERLAITGWLLSK